MHVLFFGPRGEEMTPLRASTNLITLQGGQEGGHLAVSYCSTADNQVNCALDKAYGFRHT